jgi:hypothetical protein
MRLHSPKFVSISVILSVNVAYFRNILQNILHFITKDRDTYSYTYITEIGKNLGECISFNTKIYTVDTTTSFEQIRRGG